MHARKKGDQKGKDEKVALVATALFQQRVPERM
jgi:hypothetical protein